MKQQEVQEGQGLKGGMREVIVGKLNVEGGGGRRD